jgi:hypothetical protein
MNPGATNEAVGTGKILGDGNENRVTAEREPGSASRTDKRASD